MKYSVVNSWSFIDLFHEPPTLQVTEYSKRSQTSLACPYIPRDRSVLHKPGSFPVSEQTNMSTLRSTHSLLRQAVRFGRAGKIEYDNHASEIERRGTILCGWQGWNEPDLVKELGRDMQDESTYFSYNNSYNMYVYTAVLDRASHARTDESACTLSTRISRGVFLNYCHDSRLNIRWRRVNAISAVC